MSQSKYTDGGEDKLGASKALNERYPMISLWMEAQGEVSSLTEQALW